MENGHQQHISQTGLSPQDDAAKTSALIGYGLMVAGLFTGIFWIIGAFWAMVKKGDAAGSIFEDHYTNIITVFWWGLAFTITGFILLFVLVGYVILFAVWLWAIYRIVKGLAKITSNKPYSA